MNEAIFDELLDRLVRERDEESLSWGCSRRPNNAQAQRLFAAEATVLASTDNLVLITFPGGVVM